MLQLSYVAIFISASLTAATLNLDFRKEEACEEKDIECKCKAFSTIKDQLELTSIMHACLRDVAVKLLNDLGMHLSNHVGEGVSCYLDSVYESEALLTEDLKSIDEPKVSDYIFNIIQKRNLTTAEEKGIIKRIPDCISKYPERAQVLDFEKCLRSTCLDVVSPINPQKGLFWFFF